MSANDIAEIEFDMNFTSFLFAQGKRTNKNKSGPATGINDKRNRSLRCAYAYG